MGGGSNLCLVLQVLIVVQLSARISGIRKDVGFLGKQFCRSTVQGRYLVSDDSGHVCDALSINPQSRCCPETGHKFSCHGCNLVSECCDSYEYCVSCCLHPSRIIKEQALEVKIAKPASAGNLVLPCIQYMFPFLGLCIPYVLFTAKYSSVFDFCAGRCRHNSESVVHENAYRSEFHHCFSLPSNSSAANYTFLEARLNGINVLVGRQGESCDSVCKSKGQSCVPNKLLVLNQCDIIQKYMSCKGTCLASIGSDQPAEVVDDAPEHLNPGACLYTQTQSMLSCYGSHQHTRRLCPCA
uniref:uncharacterized protein LOC101312310 isoform X2 n=1 Tax=Fragaria vesca subsp. vesca TaxID=101020 RepID=UPI0005C8098F|nr:PREDICTED: uncharacterized protein LOC101312310 isoform X2 [Fragaria vesca subsp. vesca]